MDFVYYGGYHPEMGLLLRQAAEQGVKASGWVRKARATDINAIAGDAVEGMLLTLPADFSQSAANAEIVKAFQAKKRNAAGAFQMTAYTATWPSPTASRALAARIRPRSPSSCTPTRSTPRSARSPGTSRAT